MNPSNSSAIDDLEELQQIQELHRQHGSELLKVTVPVTTLGTIYSMAL